MTDNRVLRKNDKQRSIRDEEIAHNEVIYKKRFIWKKRRKFEKGEQRRRLNHMCVTDTGSGRRQGPLLGSCISEECVFQQRSTASYMLCVMPCKFDLSVAGFGCKNRKYTLMLSYFSIKSFLHESVKSAADQQI